MQNDNLQFDGYHIISSDNRLENEKQNIVEGFLATYYYQSVIDEHLTINGQLMVLNLHTLECLSVPTKITFMLKGYPYSIYIKFSSKYFNILLDDREIIKYQYIELDTPGYSFNFNKDLDQLIIQDEFFKLVITPIPQN